MNRQLFNPIDLKWGGIPKPEGEIQAWSWCASRGIYPDIIKQEQTMCDTLNSLRAIVLYDYDTMEVLACTVINGAGTPPIRRFR
jgi:hypothetical protein